MIIYPLGVGGAFTERFFHNNYVIELDGKRLLLDAGTTLRYSLKSSGFAVHDIDYIVVSHFHFDHVGGLEELLMRRYWMKNKTTEKIQLIIHEKQIADLEKLLEPSLHNQNLTLHDYVQLISIPDDEPIAVGPFLIQMIDTVNLHTSGLQSFAFKISNKINQQNLLFSADIKNLKDSKLLEYIDEQMTLIFQDTSFTENFVHATIQEVLDYYPPALHNKLVAMHYGDEVDINTEKRIQLVQQGVPIQL